MTAYLVYARSEYEQPLTEQGEVEADGPDDAAALARERFGDGWVELQLVPAGDVRWVVGPEPGGGDR